MLHKIHFRRCRLPVLPGKKINMATCSVVIPEHLTDTLKAHQTCVLIGTLRDKQMYIAASVSCPAFTAEAVNKTVADVQPLLPGGLFVCGLCKCVSEEEVTSTQDSFAQLPVSFDYSEPLCLCLVNKGSPVATAIDQNGVQRSLSVTSAAPDAPTTSWRLARVQAKVPLTLCVGDRDSWKPQLHSNIDTLCESISSSRTKFHLLGSRILLSTAGCIGTDSDTTCDALLSATLGDTDTGRRKKETKSLEVLNFDMYRDLSVDVASEQSTYSPIINYNMETVKKCTITLPVDSVAILGPNSTAGHIAELLSLAITRQLVAMGSCISCYSQGSKFITPEPHHIKLSDFPAMVSVIYPHSVPDDKLVEERRQLHNRFCLPTDRPFFRRANQFVFPDDQASSGYLVNVHESVPPSKVSGGQRYLVQGQYTYHHYMQDRFDDNKWGCAYRSLQTLASWFRFQGYTDRPIPTHRDIQQTLVDIGDKEPKFVGSKLWIGSMEVSFVLDTYLGVTSKILSVSSGADLSSKGRELAAHFSNQGTPIMIGGGVLAHTILGVDYDEVTGDISFLILDPHFTGAEDLKVIVDKGWCGWKGPDFWDKNAHYNMCMPQRPSAL